LNNYSCRIINERNPMSLIYQIARRDPREAKRQGHRIRMARTLIVNMAAESAMLGLFALAGTIPAWVAAAFFVASTGSATGFYLFFKSGKNLRLRDKGILIPQLAVIGTLQLVFMLLAPNLAILFMLVLLLSSGFTLMEFTPRQFTIGWIIYALATGMALFMVRDQFDYPGTSPIEIGLVWLFFVLALRRLTLASAEFGRLRGQLSEKNRQLEASLEKIEMLANRDHLTGSFNRRNFMQTLEEEMQRAKRNGRSFCLVMLDLDYFKMVNDQHGHAVGDEVLKRFCAIIENGLRSTDKLARFGGEEFAILLPETPLGSGIGVANRLRMLIAEHDWDAISAGLSVSFSAGITNHEVDDSVESMMKRADEGLYSAKRAGRNCVIAAKSDAQKPQRATG
jgi:diguanylate cyclase (GGDEF)-like protein